jgi:hypothetical protein
MTAERIIVESRIASRANAAFAGPGALLAARAGCTRDALSALMNLG